MDSTCTVYVYYNNAERVLRVEGMMGGDREKLGSDISIKKNAEINILNQPLDIYKIQ